MEGNSERVDVEGAGGGTRVTTPAVCALQNAWHHEKGETSACPFYRLKGARAAGHMDKTSLVRKASLIPFPGLLPYQFGAPGLTQVLVSLDSAKSLVLTPECRVQADQAVGRPLVASLQSSLLFGRGSVSGVVRLGTAGNCLS